MKRGLISRYWGVLLLLIIFTIFHIWNTYFINQGQTDPANASVYIFAFLQASAVYLAIVLSYNWWRNRLKEKKHGAVIIYTIVSSTVLSTAFLFGNFSFIRWVFWGYSTSLMDTLAQVPFMLMSQYLPVSLVTLLFLHNNYSNELKQVISQKEKIMQQQELHFLRRQLDHHFLFNNLNFLMHLSENHDERATHFIKKMSDIYRYATEHAKDELVSLDKEIGFAKSYLEIINCRLSGQYHLNVENQSGKSMEEFFILPGTLQLLVENVIKHNDPEQGSPVNIIVKAGNDDSLTVQNVVWEKKYKYPSLGIGLQNLSAIYRISWDKEISVLNTGNLHTVIVPLIRDASQ